MTVFEKGLIMMGGSAALFAVLAIPLMLRMVPRNVVYGYRTRATLTDDALWYAANAHFGRGLLIASIISIVALWILYATQMLSPQTFLGTSVAALVAPPAIAGLATARFVHQWTKR
jgi:hypothetical protein